MSKFLSGREREFKVGIVSYSEGKTVLEVVGNSNFTGIVTASGGFNLGIHSAGSSVASGPIKTLNFVGAGNTFQYNASTDTIDVSIAGGGGASVSIGTESPESPSSGDLWYNNSVGRTFIYYDETTLGIGSTSVWVDAAPTDASGASDSGSSTVSIGQTAPGDPSSGDLWYSTDFGRIFVYYDEPTLGIGSTSVWVDAAPYSSPEEEETIGPGKAEKTVTATQGQQTFTVSGGYNAGFVDIYLNGIRLNGSEFIASNGSTVVLATAANEGDVLDVVEYTMGIGSTGAAGPAAALSIATRSGVLTQNITGIAFTVSLRSGIGTVNI
jgi:hypothetical protein